LLQAVTLRDIGRDKEARFVTDGQIASSNDADIR